MVIRRSVLHAARQDSFGRAREFIGRARIRIPLHRFEHLKQTPSLSLVTFRLQNAFSFEVDVIDKGVASLWRFRKAFKLFLHVNSVGRRRFGQHLRQRSIQSGNKKFCLQIDGVDQKPPQLVHLT